MALRSRRDFWWLHKATWSLLLVLLGHLSVAVASAEDRELCVYVTTTGRVEQVNSRARVPAAYQDQARCFQEKKSLRQLKELPSAAPTAPASANAPMPRTPGLALPQEMELSGNIRTIDMASSLGRIVLRWPRRVEELFGRTPERAMVDAARAVSRTLKSKGFPSRVQTLDLDWQVVFLDELAPSTQIPQYLVSNCHPGWMTPPTNIYIVADRIAAGCGGPRRAIGDADAELAKVLVHELGHAVEFQLLQERFSGDRLRAEGFATWFQMLAAEYSAVIPSGAARAEIVSFARKAVAASPNSFRFSGSAGDYARAAFFFEALVNRRGVSGISDVYARMGQERTDFVNALSRELSWNQQKLFEEVARAVER